MARSTSRANPRAREPVDRDVERASAGPRRTRRARSAPGRASRATRARAARLASPAPRASGRAPGNPRMTPARARAGVAATVSGPSGESTDAKATSSSPSCSARAARRRLGATPGSVPAASRDDASLHVTSPIQLLSQPLEPLVHVPPPRPPVTRAQPPARGPACRAPPGRTPRSVASAAGPGREPRARASPSGRASGGGCPLGQRPPPGAAPARARCASIALFWAIRRSQARRLSAR